MSKRKKRVAGGNDIPKNFVFLLILLTVVVSMAGTWIVLNAMTGINSISSTVPETIKEGNVNINVNPAPKVAIATGQISMEVVKVK